MTAAAATIVATIATATATTAAATAATTLRSTQRVIEFLHFGLGGGARIYHGAKELQIATGQGVVEIHYHLYGSNLLHCTQNGRAVGTHHLHHITCVYVLRVELAINGKHLAVEILNVVGVVVAICIFRCDGEIKCIALLQVLEIFLKCIEGVTHAREKLKRLLACCLFNLLTLAITV